MRDDTRFSVKLLAAAALFGVLLWISANIGLLRWRVDRLEAGMTNVVLRFQQSPVTNAVITFPAWP